MSDAVEYETRRAFNPGTGKIWEYQAVKGSPPNKHDEWPPEMQQLVQDLPRIFMNPEVAERFVENWEKVWALWQKPAPLIRNPALAVNTGETAERQR